MKRLHLIIIVFIAVAIGFASHAVQHPEEGTSKSVEGGGQSSKSQNAAFTARRSAEIQSLTKEVLLEGGQDEWFRWLAYLENASLEDLPRYLDLVGNNKTALSLIAERWVSLDPEDCFRFLVSRRGDGDFQYYDSSDAVFSELFIQKWMQRDLEAVVAALDGPEALAGLEDLRKVLFGRLLEVDLLRGLALGSRWKSFDNNVLPKSLQDWALSDPRAAVQAVFEIPESNFIGGLADLWGKSDPATALDFAFGKGGDRGFRFAEIVFARWLQDDFSAASQKLSELSEPQARLLTPILVETWSKSDPAAALDWSEKALTGKLRNDSIERIVLASAFSKGPSPKDLLAQIESPDAYHQAVVGLSHKLWGKSYSPEDKKFAEAITWFDDVVEPRTLDKIFPEFASFLADYDFGKFEELLKSPRAQTVSEQSFAFGLTSYAWHGEAPEAMALIMKAPPSYLPEASARVFATWYEKEPEAAVAWAEEISVDDPRRPFLVKELERVQWKPLDQVVAEFQVLPPVMKELFRAEIQKKQNDGITYMNVDGKVVDWGKILEVLDSDG